MPEWIRVKALNVNKNLTFQYVAKKECGALYWDEERWIVAFKCMEIFVASFFYALGKMVYHAGKSLIDWDITHLWEVARAPFYGLQMMIAALSVVVYDAYTAREWVGIIEHEWQNRRSHRDKDAVYIGFCFQKRGHIDNVNYKLIEVI